jgi:glutamate-1-semialdehyde 2,1-aminomutase
LPGGNSRHTLILDPYPVYARFGKGCRVVDVDGQERLDFVNNYASLILGHADPLVMDAVRRQLEKGTCFGMPTETEVTFASLLCRRVGTMEKIRFCNSGSEAVMMALKAARAYTGRQAIAKFEGAYHGSYDFAQVSDGPSPSEWGDRRSPASIAEPGSTASVKSEVVVLPWNDPDTCEVLLRKNRAKLAGLLVDPLPSRVGLIPPRPGFLESVQAVARDSGILVIADEVLSFRLSYHGASPGSGLSPDITVLGKIIGGGFPIGAVGGTAGVMEVFDHTQQIRVHHGGTFNANPVSMTAGLATMKQLTPAAFERLNGLGDYLRNRLAKLFKNKGIKAQVTGKGSLFYFHPTDRELTDYRSLVQHMKDGSYYNKLAHLMLTRGIIVSPGLAFGCLSTPMEETDADTFVAALYASLKSLA